MNSCPTCFQLQYSLISNVSRGIDESFWFFVCRQKCKKKKKKKEKKKEAVTNIFQDFNKTLSLAFDDYI